MWELLKRDSPFSSLWLQTLPDRTYQECCLRNVKVQSLGVTLTQPVDFSRAKKERAFYVRRFEDLLGLRFGLLGAGNVDFGGALGGFGEDGDFVGKDFGEAPGHCETVRDAGVAVGDFADAEFGDERSVPGQDPQVAIAAGDFHFLGHVFDDLAVGSYDLELERICHCVFYFPALSLTRQGRGTRSTRKNYAAVFIFSASSRTSSMPPLR